MSVWLCIPSAREAKYALTCVIAWQLRGYRVALLRTQPDPVDCPIAADYEIIAPYQGYAAACNRIIKEIMERDPDAEWFVTGGDDTFPDQWKTASEIAAECRAYFGAQLLGFGLNTFGVMQPTGDRWGQNEIGPWPRGSAYIDRVCGSPWLGREFCQRAYGGRGPYWEEYQHMFLDEELQNVALKLGILWQRPDLTHFHAHWGRDGNAAAMPSFLAPVNTQEHWTKSKAIFERRRAGGFPGHEVIS